MKLNLNLLWKLLLHYGLAIFVKVGLSKLLVLRVLGVCSILEQFDDLLGGEIVSNVAHLGSWNALHLLLLLVVALAVGLFLIWRYLVDCISLSMSMLTHHNLMTTIHLLLELLLLEPLLLLPFLLLSLHLLYCHELMRLTESSSLIWLTLSFTSLFGL